MKKAIKKHGKIIQAYQLGDDNEVINRLIEEEKIKRVDKEKKDKEKGDKEKEDREKEDKGKEVKRENGNTYGRDAYEIFSQEAVNGKGQIAYEGDYIKIDSSGTPYPNSAEFFEKNHILISGNDYEQIPKPVDIWAKKDGMCDEIKFLIEHKGLVMKEESKEKYFNAPLWGSMLSAREDAYIVFYDIDKDKDGNIIDVDFNFVAKEEFESTYEMCEEHG